MRAINMEKPFPLKYEDKMISLEKLDVDGFAWKREDFLKFLEDQETSEFAILGGDVLSFEEGRLSYTYDNWTAPDRIKTESFNSFCKRTRDAALQYVRAYPPIDNVVFSPVITSETTAGWEA
jgi:hypothetical protein